MLCSVRIHPSIHHADGMIEGSFSFGVSRWLDERGCVGVSRQDGRTDVCRTVCGCAHRHLTLVSELIWWTPAAVILNFDPDLG